MLKTSAKSAKKGNRKPDKMKSGKILCKLAQKIFKKISKKHLTNDTDGVIILSQNGKGSNKSYLNPNPFAIISLRRVYI